MKWSDKFNDNPNDLWEEMPWMRGNAYVEIYPPLHHVTGKKQYGRKKVIIVPLIPPRKTDA